MTTTSDRAAMNALPVLQVCAEFFPLLKTGGLADVCGALPGALAAQGCEMRTLLPAFPAVLRGVADLRPVERWQLVREYCQRFNPGRHDR